MSRVTVGESGGNPVAVLIREMRARIFARPAPTDGRLAMDRAKRVLAAMALGAAIYDGSGFTLVLPVAATTLAVAVLCRVALWLNRRAEFAVAD